MEDNGIKNDTDPKTSDQDDIFAEETVEPEEEDSDDASAPGSGEAPESGRDVSHGTDQRKWNGGPVNPDQWSRYRSEGSWDAGRGSSGKENFYDHQYQENPYQNQYNGYYQQENARGFAVASLVLGIISLLCFCSFFNLLPAILALIFGGISLSKSRNGNGMAIAGMICGGVSIVLLVFTVVIMTANGSFINAMQNYMNNYFRNSFRY